VGEDGANLAICSIHTKGYLVKKNDVSSALLKKKRVKIYYKRYMKRKEKKRKESIEKREERRSILLFLALWFRLSWTMCDQPPL
jgi:hypothetical protein